VQNQCPKLLQQVAACNQQNNAVLHSGKNSVYTGDFSDTWDVESLQGAYPDYSAVAEFEKSEVVRLRPYEQKSDIWRIGVILPDMPTARNQFAG
jgi:hypothetical protein